MKITNTKLSLVNHTHVQQNKERVTGKIQKCNNTCAKVEIAAIITKLSLLKITIIKIKHQVKQVKAKFTTTICEYIFCSDLEKLSSKHTKV